MVMLRAAVIAGTVVAASATSAQSRPSTSAITCQAAQALVRSQRAVVLDTGPGTYDRFVNGPGQCVRGEYAAPAWAPTRDAAQCFIGYSCRSGPPMQNEQ
jgi:hypothetical protein